MVVDLLAFVGGIAYGYMNPGREDRKAMLKKGLKIGVLVGIVLAIISMFIGGFVSFGGALFSSIISVSFLTLIFVGGTIIGDWIEVKFKK
tara:strand:- start:79 stop:348 length:270 start_codon:yes stop_codon:yes gene_type:complete